MPETTTTDLQRIADELAIRNLLGRILDLLDNGDLEDFMGCWTDQPSWEIPGVAPLDRAAIRASKNARRAAGQEGPGSGHRHVATNQVVRFDGPDTAASDSYVLFVSGAATTPVVEGVYQNRETYRRTPAGWKLDRRVSARA